MNQDEEHLRLLSIFHYVVGGLTALLACFPCIHLAVGIALVSGAISVKPQDEAPLLLVGTLFIIIPAIIILAGWTLAVTILFAGRFLAQRAHYTYCMTIAGIECIVFPFGTILGVFTIIVLNRASVRGLFQGENWAPPPS